MATPTDIAPRPRAVERGGSGEIIRTVALTKVYAGTDFRAVDELDLSVGAGEIFGLLGPNGAGKTTTAGMLTTRVIPTSGSAHVGGIDVVAEPTLAKQLIGVVSQQNTLDRQASPTSSTCTSTSSTRSSSASWRCSSRSACASSAGGCCPRRALARRSASARQG